MRYNGTMLNSRKHVVQDWTAAEADRLMQLAKRRLSAARAARSLGRRIGSVRRQAKVLGILLYKK